MSLTHLTLTFLLLLKLSAADVESGVEDVKDGKEPDELIEDTVMLNSNDSREREDEEVYSTTEGFRLDEELIKNDTLKEIDEDDITTSTPLDTTTADVYKHPSTKEDTDSNNDSEITSTASTKAMEVEEENSDEDIEVPAQRNPKTENEPPKDPEPTRAFDPKPQIPTTASRSSTLKAWLQDSWLRSPCGVLVPLRASALGRARRVWGEAAAGGLNVTDVLLVGYDTNGVNWRSRHNLQHHHEGKSHGMEEALSKLLLKYQSVRQESTADGTMKALITATKLVPYDSALFIITDRGAGDPQRLPLALRALVEKRLKVYTIWTDPAHPSVESDVALQELRNISRHTEGDVLPYVIENVETPNNLAADAGLQQWAPMELKKQRQARVNTQHDFERFDTLLVRRGGGEAISLGLPVEGGVTALKVLIEGAVEHAVFYPPNEAPQIDLYNDSSVATFSSGSKTQGVSPREVYLVFPGSVVQSDVLTVLPASSELGATMVGTWHLSVKCDTCDYRLIVSARSSIHLEAEAEDRNTLRIRVTGAVASVRESLLVDEYGTELAKLSFSYQPMAGDGQEVQADPVTELVADVVMPKLNAAKVYVKILGRDFKGESFVRLSGPLGHTETRQSRSASIAFPDAIDDLEAAEEDALKYSQIRFNSSEILPSGRALAHVTNQQGEILTAVQIGLSSRLYGSPGDSLQLHFEVSNYRDQAVRFNFKAEGELRFLTGINPTNQVVQSGQTVNVIVSLRIRSAAQPGARELVTFTALGVDQVSISAYVYVTNPIDRLIDTWAPEMRHSFQGSCIGRMGDDCNTHIWSATVVARDNLAGLLRLSSSPQGLMYSTNYISGTREQVIATYRSTCCVPRVMVTAVDSYGNVNSYMMDISYYFSAGEIAAIVLGILLIIAIIILVIYLIYVCVRRRKESRELPYTASSRNIS